MKDSLTCSAVLAEVSKKNMFLDLANSAAFSVGMTCYAFRSDLFPKEFNRFLPTSTRVVPGSA